MALADIVKSVGDGKHSLSKWTQTIAFLTCTGVICWYAYNLQLSEWMFGLYFGVAVGGNILNKKIAVDKVVEEKKIDAAIEPERSS
ncbi:hypothetical protein [Erwinia sp. 9145]|uniref:hypothetical protein n=1 Tax=Erwinia sp. 9145 TaxID=1500895 RepID=UPI00055163AF|nr:hypothetical protein [Erwinia sp. 9145]